MSMWWLMHSKIMTQINTPEGKKPEKNEVFNPSFQSTLYSKPMNQLCAFKPLRPVSSPGTLGWRIKGDCKTLTDSGSEFYKVLKDSWAGSLGLFRSIQGCFCQQAIFHFYWCCQQLWFRLILPQDRGGRCVEVEEILQWQWYLTESAMCYTVQSWCQKQEF